MSAERVRLPKMESVQERVQKVLERVIRDVVGQEKRYREIIADNDSISATVSKTKSMVALKRERIDARGRTSASWRRVRCCPRWCGWRIT